jgi:hypothetical protein
MRLVIVERRMQVGKQLGVFLRLEPSRLDVPAALMSVHAALPPHRVAPLPFQAALFEERMTEFYQKVKFENSPVKDSAKPLSWSAASFCRNR